MNPVPDALAPGFKYVPNANGEYTVRIQKAKQVTGLVDYLGNGKPLKTWVYGYGDPADGLYTWPGRTFEVQSGADKTIVNWENGLNPNSKKKFGSEHLLPVDTSMHWCYSLHDYVGRTIENDGVPIITHLHGGHSDYQFDGNPEFFYNYNMNVVGPQWANVLGGFTTRFEYDNNVPAGNLWYHDHALGITRLNVYAGLAGFYFVRDGDDTGDTDNTLGLPSWPYEKAYAIQDRMFLNTGELFYPAFPGDPFYHDFIIGEGADLANGPFDGPFLATGPDGESYEGFGPTGLAEFFGDHMVVNGVIWPFEAVEPRNYRLHLLNGTDSRFMALQFYAVPAGATDLSQGAELLEFSVIGSDQGLASAPNDGTTTLLSEPGSRYDVIVNFGNLPQGMSRVIMWNIGGDEPFGGDVPGPQAFSHTDRVMAFDVVLPFDMAVADRSPTGINFGPHVLAGSASINRPNQDLSLGARKVALFEGKDEFGRLQPLLGTAEPAVDFEGNTINWPDTPVYKQAVMPDGTSQIVDGTSTDALTGPMEGSIPWHSPTTENPALGATEEWEVWNMTGDGHPVHLHLVHFEILGRKAIKWDSHTIEAGDMVPDPNGADGVFIEATEDDETRVIPNAFYSDPEGNGTYLVTQPTVQHNSVAGDPATYGMGFRIVNPTTDGPMEDPNTRDGYIENAPKDMVTALPEEVTYIKAHFDKPGRYVWHCHILSHEDHEMMRVLHVGEGA